MDLIGYENAKVIHLVNFMRPEGQLPLLDVVAGLGERYSFLKVPTPEELLRTDRVFRVGKFKNVGITEFGIYSDGFIVQSAADTDLLDEFIDDAINWAKSEFGLSESLGISVERSYESYLYVKAKTDLAKALAPKNDLASLVNRTFKTDRYPRTDGMQLTGFLLEIDHSKYLGRRKPLNLIVDRRLGLPFEENIFFAQGPLRTKDFLAFLRGLENLALEV